MTMGGQQDPRNSKLASSPSPLKGILPAGPSSCATPHSSKYNGWKSLGKLKSGWVAEVWQQRDGTHAT
ncbi:hypothetical protein E2C01_050937 [Portunus trituberculatus]|uniref:Uncharacterized protein n=1 Tax=Portunus trituberculatus TaxID=210409 RepID=A0A5B7GHF5_PORTR|nr:hypothetical protein [Portunus trituberculatus]